MSENKFEETKDALLEFISKNSDEIKAYLFLFRVFDRA